MSKLNIKDKNLAPEIKQTYKEIYEDFISVHGGKHKDRVKQLLENISAKVKKKDLYMDALASANSQMGVVYGKSSKLSPILKHELFHVFNDSAIDSKDSLAYMPERYKKIFEDKGIIRTQYEKVQNERKERFKDAPEILDMVLTDYETFREQFVLGDGDQEVEKWTEWFNTKTNTRDMKNNFCNWDNGFYTRSLSSKSFYDCYINLAEMVSKLFPEEKILDMFMDNPSYRTEYTYKHLIDEFDEKYGSILSEEEKEEYSFPYLKVMMDTLTISDNARKDNSKARNAYQSCTNTLFKAYLEKINSMTDFGKDELKSVFAEIKDLQDSMMWNVDITKMRELDYIQTLNQIQDRFKQMCLEINSKGQDEEITQLMEQIHYESHYQKVNNGDDIARDIFLNVDDNNKENTFSIGKFTTKTGINGIKGNLYESLRILFGDEAFNLLFEEYQNEQISFLTNSSSGNKLVELYNKIKSADKESEYFSIYEEIYELYNKKIDERLVTDENINSELEKFSKEIIKMQQCALFNSESSKFHPNLENIIDNYNSKIQEYREFITRITEESVKEEENDSSKEHLWKLANIEFGNLEKYISSIEATRSQIAEDSLKKQKISGQELGTQTIKEQEDTTEKDNVVNDISHQVNKQKGKEEKNG